MRAILNFLATALAALSSHMGGGAVDSTTAAKPVEALPMAVVSSPVDLSASLRGAQSAIFFSYLVQDPQPITIIRYVKTPNHGRKVVTPEVPFSEAFARIPSPVELGEIKKFSTILIEKAQNGSQEVPVSVDLD